MISEKNNMKAIMYGAGNIGRGFIGALLSQAGYSVTFIDIDAALVDALNERRCYPLRIISDKGHTDMQICNVQAVNGNDTEKVAKAIAQADIMATAVGANILKYIAPNIAAGLRKRFVDSGQPLDILICENLMDADKVLAGLIKEHMTEEEQHFFDERVGMVEASIGRMVPVQTQEMKAGDPLRVCVEGYDYLPVDKAAFKGNIPSIDKLVPYSPFGFYIRRKLYIHNMGHAICAYLGLYQGYSFIHEAVGDSDIRLIAKSAMLESMEALCIEYAMPEPQILRHIDDLLNRFANRSLGDTCARVGADTKRKLAPSDRLVGAATFSLCHDVFPSYISIGAAAAVFRHLDDAGIPQSRENALTALKDISKLDNDSGLVSLILQTYDQLMKGSPIKQLWLEAEARKAEGNTDIV